MSNELTEEKTVLVVFRSHRRRPVTFSSGKTPKEERENLPEAILTAFHDVLETGEGTSTTNDYYLQMESNEWDGRNIDVTGFVQQRNVIHLCTGTSEKVVRMYVLYVRAVVTAVLRSQTTVFFVCMGGTVFSR